MTMEHPRGPSRASHSPLEGETSGTHWRKTPIHLEKYIIGKREKAEGIILTVISDILNNIPTPPTNADKPPNPSTPITSSWKELI